MFSTDFIFRQQENLVDNQKCQAGFRPLCNKIPLSNSLLSYLAQLQILVISLYMFLANLFLNKKRQKRRAVVIFEKADESSQSLVRLDCIKPWLSAIALSLFK